MKLFRFAMLKTAERLRNMNASGIWFQTFNFFLSPAFPLMLHLTVRCNSALKQSESKNYIYSSCNGVNPTN